MKDDGLGPAKMRLMHEVGKYKINFNENSYLYGHVFVTDPQISRKYELRASDCFENNKLKDYRCSLFVRRVVKPSPKWKLSKDQCN